MIARQRFALQCVVRKNVHRSSDCVYEQLAAAVMECAYMTKAQKATPRLFDRAPGRFISLDPRMHNARTIKMGENRCIIIDVELKEP